jgi:hypothetical protein
MIRVKDKRADYNQRKLLFAAATPLNAETEFSGVKISTELYAQPQHFAQ